MSKLGAHVRQGNRTGFGAYLHQCAIAGSPVPVLVSLQQNLWPDVVQFSPQTILIYRTKSDDNDNPLDLYKVNPIVSAQAWYAAVAPNWRLNRAHYYAPLNEPNPCKGSQAENTWLSDFLIASCDLAEADGFHIAAFGASVGTPDYLDWEWLRPAMRRMKQGDHLLLLHEYGLTDWLRDATPDLALRYRQAHEILGDDCPDIVIGEASGGAGYDANGLYDAEWLADVKWYDSELMKDRYVLGAALYQIGGAENFYKLLPQLADYISTHPTIEPPEPQEDQYALLAARVSSTELEIDDERDERKDDTAGLISMIDALAARIKKLEGGTPPPPPPPPPAPHDVVFGLHCRADGGDLPRVEYDALGLIHSRVIGYKFLTGCSVSHYSAVINGQHYTPSLCMTRMFWDARGETVRPSPARFVELMRAGINDAYHFGIRCFELLNEPNLYDEWRANWGGPVGFVDWAIQVIALLRGEWPSMRIISPGLAPIDDIVSIGENTDRWITAFKDGELFNACDFAGAHAYWRTRSTMLTDDDGLNFFRYLKATNRPIWITEFSNNKANDTDSDKGAQYCEYLDYLRANEPRVERAYAYVMSSGSKSDNDTRQTWVRGGAVTDIARAVGA